MAEPGVAAADAREAFGAPVTRSTLRALAPASIAVVLLLVATAYDGAFDVRHWGPVAIFSLLALVALVLAGATRPLDPVSRVALAALWAFVAWSLLSAVWAADPGAAIEGGARNGFYAALASIALIAVPGPREARRVGALLVAGIVVLAAVTLLRMRLDGAELFVAGRLDAPTGYRNATACLFAIPFWPLLGVAASKARNPSLRALSFAAAVLVLGLVFVTQSRGALVGLAIGGVLALVIGPEWLRRPWLALLAAVGLVLLSAPLLGAHRAFEGGTGPVTVEHVETSAGALIFLVFDALIVGLLIALLDGGLRASPEVMRRAKRVAAIGLVAGAAALVGGAIAAAGDPIGFVRERVADFQKVPERGEELTRLISTGGERYDLWRVAADQLAAAPVTGVGQGGYQRAYFAERASERNLTDPHGLPLSLLAETGIVGALLFGTFVVAVLYAILARAWPASLPARRAAAGLAGGAGVVLGQALVDWIWIIPGVMGIGLVCLGLALVAITPRPAQPGPARPPAPLVLRGLGAAGLLAAAMLVTALFLADFEIGEARGAARADPRAAIQHARAAQALAPWSVTPRLLQAGALELIGDVAGARAELGAAESLAPGGHVIPALQGDLELRAGDRAAAHRAYRRARGANPRDRGLRELAKMTRSRDFRAVAQPGRSASQPAR